MRGADERGDQPHFVVHVNLFDEIAGCELSVVGAVNDGGVADGTAELFGRDKALGLQSGDQREDSRELESGKSGETLHDKSGGNELFAFFIERPDGLHNFELALRELDHLLV